MVKPAGRLESCAARAGGLCDSKVVYKGTMVKPAQGHAEGSEKIQCRGKR